MRVLAIEDEPRLLHNLARALREQGFAVDTAADGEDGLRKALANDYDCILLDVLLPGLDGWGVLEHLRRTKATPVLMLTALDAVDHRIKGLNTGADDYLVKPFDLGELFARVRALIRRSAQGARPVLELAPGLSIDLSSKRVERDGAELSLTSREYAILEYLSLHKGDLVTRTELYEHLFDENEDSLSNLIDVHVSNLRKKLGSPLITTRRGQGYCLESPS